MKLYSKNQIPLNDSFRYIVIGTFPGLTCKNWHYLINHIIIGGLDDILFVHVENKQSSKEINTRFNSNYILNSKSELIDFYKISGVQHLLFVDRKDITVEKQHSSGNILPGLVKKASAIYADSSLISVFDNDCIDSRLVALPPRLSDFNIISKLLYKGMVKKAAFELGYFYQLRGTIIEGISLGQKLGYPTANISIDDIRKKIPTNGVYVSMVNIANNWYKSMINIGVRPTLNKRDFAIEAHIFDFKDTIYGKNISVHLIDRLRDEKRFSSVEALKEQIIKDEKQALCILENIENEFNINDGFCFI